MSSPTQSQPSIRSQLIGAWELIEYSAWVPSPPSSSDDSNSNDNDKDIVYPLGPDAQGIIMYTPNGYMSAQLQRPGQHPFPSNDLAGTGTGTDTKDTEDWAEAAHNYLAYTGPFYIDESDSPQHKDPVLMHHMTNCNFPNWMGNTQRRLVEITYATDEKTGKKEKYLTLGPEAPAMVMGKMRMARLKWRRLEDNFEARPPTTTA